MADLEACYFCGSAPGGALEEYAVVPAALSPSPDQQRSVVLCPTCREKLTTVLTPVVEAAGAAGGGDVSPSAGDPGVSGSGGEAGDDGDDGVAPGDGVDDAGTSARPDDEPTDADGVTLDPAGGDAAPSGGDPAPSSGDGGRSDGTAEPSGGAPDSSSVEGTAGTSADDGSADPSAVDPGDGGGSDDAADPARAPDVADRTPEDDPRNRDEELLGRDSRAYNKVLRLLRNREFPVERHEIEEVAASAYQMDPQEVSDAIDTVIQKGMLVQEGSHLRRP